ncbi:Methylesterase 1 [Abeliophyllum distichum]|uniref:Methylesterase 1 n=1 Tax=Abeliophyllum distichum TaxID=126358 RepID=A0ABD1V3L3_9LAMI
MNMALAMEKYPNKISVAVFVNAFMPDTLHTPSYVLDKDVALAKALVRPSSLFREDLSKKSAFSNEGFGSVKRAYIVSAEDKALKEEFQRWEIENSGVAIVKEVKNADHMVMLSKPQKLCQCLLDIVN